MIEYADIDYIDYNYKEMDSDRYWHVIRMFDNRQWWVYGDKLHRLDGPASMSDTGYSGWYISGIEYFSNKLFQEDANLTDEEMTAIILKYGNVGS